MKQSIRTKTLTAALFFAVLLFTLPSISFAYVQLMQDSESPSKIIAMPVANDGFLYAAEYYRDGPGYRICLPQEGKRIVSGLDGCKDKVRIKNGFFSLSGFRYEYEPAGIGITPQDYIDSRFGVGVAEVVGIGNRLSKHIDHLVIFYRTL